MSLLEIDDLYVTYTSAKSISSETEVIKAVNGVNLEIKKGEVLAIAGESGCGKSTLAKAIMKLVDAKSGEIIFEDKNILHLKKKEDLKKFLSKNSDDISKSLFKP